MKPPVKWKRVLQAFITGRTWNRFEAARELSDHCLHSTVATIERKGVRVARRDEMVPGYMGIKTKCRRYWLEPAEQGIAEILLMDDATQEELMSVLDDLASGVDRALREMSGDGAP